MSANGASYRKVGVSNARWQKSPCPKRKPGKRKPTKAKPGDDRIAYDVGLTLLIPEREAMRKRAADERRSLGAYVTRLVVEQIR